MKTTKQFNMRFAIFLAATILIVCGLVLMYGEGSDSETFRPEIFSPIKIRLAPFLCLVGYLLIPLGIMVKGKECVERK